jgi:hypothetical protein
MKLALGNKSGTVNFSKCRNGQLASCARTLARTLRGFRNQIERFPPFGAVIALKLARAYEIWRRLCRLHPYEL